MEDIEIIDSSLNKDTDKDETIMLCVCGICFVLMLVIVMFAIA